MSRNNKNTRLKAAAKVITSMHLKGEKGPSSTSPKHGKRWGYRNNPEVAKRLAEMAKLAGGTDAAEKTSGKRILRSAGKASALAD